MLSLAQSTPVAGGGTYRADIDGLRAVAVLLVVVFHAWPAQLRGGYLGVDVFFVISGYLITRIIASELRAETFSFVRFYARRARRLLPALVVVLPVAIVLGWYIQLAGEFQLLGREVVGAMFFVSNFVFMAEAGYFDAAAETKPLLHFWSLGVEEQFYLTFPLLLFLLHRRRVSLLGTITVVGGASLALHVLIDAVSPTAAFYLPMTRAWELMAGAFLAETTVNRSPQSGADAGRLATAGSLAGGAAVGAGVLSAGVAGLSAVVPVLLAVSGAAMLIWAGPTSAVNRHVLSRRLVVGIGLISYPLYLWHWLLLASLRSYYGHERAGAYVPAVVGISVALACLTYWCVERPVRSRMALNRRWMTGMATAAAVVTLAGGVVWARDGYPERIRPRLRALGEFATSPHEPYDNGTCESMVGGIDGLDLDSCLSSSPEAPTVVLLGDSHANQYYKSLARMLPGASVLHLGRWSCLPFSSRTHQTDVCRGTLAAAQTYITRTRSVSTVILTGYWNYLIAGRFETVTADFRRAAPVNDAETEVFLRTGHELVTALLAADKRVVLLLDAPNLNFNIQHCVYNPARGSDAPDVPPRCALNRQDFEARNAVYDRVMKQLVAAHPALRLFDPRSVLCDDEACHAMRDGRPLYFDSDHLSARGADMVVERMIAAGIL